MRDEGAQRYGVLASTSSVRHELEIKRSRFLCRIQRVESGDEARDVIAEERQAHRLARHHCSAFVLGPRREVQRSNDDGEPSGTAGVPMLDAIVQRERAGAGADLSDLVAVVTRYFGGVLLGAGGLVRAYSDAVSRTLDRADTCTRELRTTFALEAPHATAGRWENELRTRGARVLETDYLGHTATISLAVPSSLDDARALEQTVATVTAGAGALVELGRDWVDLARDS